MTSNYNDPINILDTSNATGVGSGGSLNLRGGASIQKDLYIGGNVNISGTTTAFSDNIILINQNPINSADTGLLFERYSNDITNNKKYSGIIYSENNDEYILGYLENDPNRGNATINGFIGLQSNNLKLYSSTNATGTGTGGALTVLGGSAISHDLFVGGDIKFFGNLYQNGNLFNGGNSQWTTSINNIYYTSGNVGIGTTNPQYKLQIDTNDTVFPDAALFISPSSNETSKNAAMIIDDWQFIQDFSGTGSKDFMIFQTATALNRFYISTSGNVGIGTTTPTVKLYVNGDISGTNITTTSINASTGITTGSLQSTNINTTNITIGNFNTTNFNTTNITTSTINATTGITAGTVQSTNINTTNITTSTINASTGITTGNINATNISVGTFIVSGGTFGSIITTSGNVGIGTTSPAQKLHIRSASSNYVRIESNTDATGQESGVEFGIPSFSSATRSKITSTTFPGDASDLKFLTGAGANSSIVRMTLATSGNVGIGSTSPSELLQINGNIRVGPTSDSNTEYFIKSAGQIVIHSNDASSQDDSYVGTVLKAGTSSNLSSIEIMGAPTSSTYKHISFITQNTERMRLSSAGNLGIGTTSPTAGIHIRNSGLTIQSDNNTNQEASLLLTNGTTGSNWTLANGTGASAPGIFSIYNWGAGKNIISCLTSGNVGIDTTSPNELLHLNRTGAFNYIKLSGDVNQEQGIQIGDTQTRWWINKSSNTSDLTLYDGSDRRVTFKNGGNVGIGTTNPIYKLDVTGQHRINSTTTTDGQLIMTSANGGGVIQFHDPHHSIWGRIGHNGLNDKMQLREFGNIELWTGGLLSQQSPRLTVTSTGNVGIGTTGPSSVLSVLGSGSSGTIRIYPNSYRGETSIGFYENSTSGSAWILGQGGWSGGTNFVLGHGGYSSGAILTVTTAGNVGIGTTSPAQKLEVAGAIRISTAPSISYDGDATIVFNQAGVGATIQAFQFDVRTGSATSRMRITDSGNIGIGTISPSAPLQIKSNSNTSPSANGLYVFNETNSSSQHSIITIRTAGSSGGNPFLSLDVNNTGGWSIGVDNSDSQKLKISSSWDNLSNATKLMIDRSTGVVGIGSNDTSFAKLYINGYVTKNNFTATYYNSNNVGFNGTTTMNRNLSIYTSDHIACQELQVYSDERIKTNIQDIDDSTALDILRQIQPKKYTYIDIVNKGTDPVWGFLAQQVKSVLDYAVLEVPGFIPNVFARADLTHTTNGTLFTLLSENTSKLTNTDTSGSFSITMKIIYSEEDIEKEIVVSEIIDSTTFMTTEILDYLPNRIFVYGQKVDNFQSLNKNAIYTIAVAALQEVDRQLQNEIQEHQETKQELNTLKTFLQNKFPGEI